MSKGLRVVTVWRTMSCMAQAQALPDVAPGTGPATVNLGKDTRFRADGCGPWVAAG